MELLFCFLLFVVAFLYASVGHGGASGYLALMALFSVNPYLMKSSALILNLFVSIISFIRYYKEGYFTFRLFWPFAITSVPFAYLGAQLPLSEVLYKQILGLCLLLAIFRLLYFEKDLEENHGKLQILPALFIGAGIGLLSGMIGIGGGIILSTVILLLHWGRLKETAAVSALFIFVNSLSGIAGLVVKGIMIENTVWIWVIIAFAGGFAGAYAGAKKFKFLALKYILAGVLMIASVKLFLI